MKEILIIGGITAALYWYVTSQQAAVVPVAGQTSTEPAADTRLAAPWWQGGETIPAGGGGYEGPSGGMTGDEYRQPTWYHSPFDWLFAQAYNSAPTYRDQYPVAPGVIHV